MGAHKEKPGRDHVCWREPPQWLQTIRHAFPCFFPFEIIASFAYCLFTFLQPGEWAANGMTFFPALATGITVYVVIVMDTTAAIVHFNPAITITIWAAKKIPTKHMLFYLLAQVIGGILASSFVFLLMRSYLVEDKGMTSQSFFDALNPCGSGELGIGPNCTAYSVIRSYSLDHTSNAIGIGLLSEVLTSGLMCLATLVEVYNRDFTDKTGALMLGFIVFLGIGAGTKVGAGCLNPLRSNAPWLFHPIRIYENWVFTVGPIIGALLGALVYKAFYQTMEKLDVDYHKQEQKENANI